MLTDAGFAARRGQQFAGGRDSPDVVCDALPGIHLESKRTERLSVYEALAQARADCGDKTPVVAHRRNNRQWLAVMDLSDFLKILKAGED